MNTSLLFATARVRANEKNILSPDKITRLVDAETLSDAVRTLQEYNYGGGITIADAFRYDEILSAERDVVEAFVRDIGPEKCGMDAFYIENDYHNAKVCMKCKYNALELPSEALSPDFRYNAVELFEALVEDKYDKLSVEMATALHEIDVRYSNGDRRPSTIDTLLDRAAFTEIASYLSRIRGAECIRRYFMKRADCANLLTLFRTRKAELGAERMKDALLPSGSIPESVIRGAYDYSNEKLIDVIKSNYPEYRAFVTMLIEETSDPSYVKGEALADKMSFDVLKAERGDMSSVGLIAYYYMIRLLELKQVRIILTGIKNGIDKAQIRKRLRELYA